MTMSERERLFLEPAPVGRLATVDGDGRPHVVPVCFVLVDGRDELHIHTPIDEKPKDAAPGELRRVRDVERNPRVAFVVDRYEDDWTRLGWVQVRGMATVRPPENRDHDEVVQDLRAKYPQYADHALESRPTIDIQVGSVRSWGRLSWEV